MAVKLVAAPELSDRSESGTETETPDLDDGLYCDPCGRKYLTKTHLRRHLVTIKHRQSAASTTRPLIPDGSTSRLQFESVVLMNEEPGEDENKVHSCIACDRVYGSARSLKRHLSSLRHRQNATTMDGGENLKKVKMEVEDDGSRFYCDACDHTYYGMRELDRHLATFRHSSNVKAKEDADKDGMVNEESEEMVNEGSEEIVVNEVSHEDLVDEDPKKAVMKEVLNYEDVHWYKCKFCTRIFMVKSTAVEHCLTHNVEDSSSEEEDEEGGGGGESGGEADDEEDDELEV